MKYVLQIPVHRNGASSVEYYDPDFNGKSEWAELPQFENFDYSKLYACHRIENARQYDTMELATLAIPEWVKRMIDDRLALGLTRHVDEQAAVALTSAIKVIAV